MREGNRGHRERNLNIILDEECTKDRETANIVELKRKRGEVNLSGLSRNKKSKKRKSDFLKKAKP